MVFAVEISDISFALILCTTVRTPVVLVKVGEFGSEMLVEPGGDHRRNTRAYCGVSGGVYFVITLPIKVFGSDILNRLIPEQKAVENVWHCVSSLCYFCILAMPKMETYRYL